MLEASVLRGPAQRGGGARVRRTVRLELGQLRADQGDTLADGVERIARVPSRGRINLRFQMIMEKKSNCLMTAPHPLSFADTLHKRDNSTIIHAIIL